MSDSKAGEIKVKIEADILAEHEGVVVIGTKLNGRYSKDLLYVNIDEFDSEGF